MGAMVNVSSGRLWRKKRELYIFIAEEYNTCCLILAIIVILLKKVINCFHVL